MNTNSPNQCPQCGEALAAGLNGLCPNCLAMVGFGVALNAAETLPAEAGQPTPRSAGRPVLSSTVRYFGDYELLEEIARGGMGVVYRARQVSLNRIVAVKMILSGKFATESDVKRFRTEAEAAANLQHPNIVAIHEVGEHEGRHYFSMDYVEGKNLAELVKDGPLPPAKAAPYVKTIAEAIHFAHQRGTLHRDLKPHNVLIDHHDQPRITDFGLAKHIESDAGLTQSGAVLGSPSYMPPEQATGRHHEVGPASDVYSLGAILYQLLTGKAPFAGATPLEIIRQVVETEPVPPSKLNPKTPPDLETICLKCLEKRPERRYHSARELAEELERFLNYEPILARPASNLRKTWSWAQQKPWIFAAGLGLLVLILACVAYGLWENSRFLAWKLETGQKALPTQMEPPWRPWGLTKVSPSGKESFLPKGGPPALLFLNLFPGVMFLLYFFGKSFRQTYRRRAESGTTVPGWRLLVHGGMGATATVFGMGYLLLQIRSWVWLPTTSHILALELVSVACALALVWIAIRMVWESVGMHETARFRGTVDKSMERQLADEAWRWPVLKLVGFALWVILVVWGLGLMAFFLTVHSRGLAVLIGIAGMLLGIAVVWLVAWVVRKRLRLFTFVFAPLVLVLFGLGIGALTSSSKTVATSLLCPVLSAIVMLPGLLFFGGSSASQTGERRRFPVNPWLDAVYGLAFFIAMSVLFHVEENWRGRRAWERVKADLAAKGESLDYAALLKPAVPDAVNVMAHPYMRRHFLKGTMNLPIAHPPFDIGGGKEPSPYALEALRGLPRQSEPTLSVLSLVGDHGSRELIPTLQFSNQRLTNVISDLARLAGLNFRPGTNQWQRLDFAGTSKPRLVARNFTNTTALQALDALAKENDLSPDPVQWRDSRMLVFTDVTPSLQGILDWYERYRGEFAQLEEALQRPHSRIIGDPGKLLAMPIPNFASFRQAAQAYANLCQIHLLLGDADAALRDLRLLHRLMEAELANEPPILVTTMIKVAMGGMFASVLQQTLAEGLWPRAHLEQIQRLCEGADLLADVSRSVRAGERAGMLQFVQSWSDEGKGRDLLTGVLPSKTNRFSFVRWVQTAWIADGWIDQNRANYARLMQFYLEGVDAATGRLDVRLVKDGETRCQEELRANAAWGFYMLPVIAIPNVGKALGITARNHTLVNEAYLACALELHRAVKGSYPDMLDSLVPEFAAKLPHDVFDSQPLRYRRTDDGKYTLYSIGWNSKDDQGELPTGRDGEPEWQDEKGDWVWQGVPKR